MQAARLNPTLRKIAREIEEFEASRSVAHTGTGERREGKEFEHLIGTFWQALRKTAVDMGACVSVVKPDSDSETRFAKLNKGTRSLLLPMGHATDHSGNIMESHRHRWLETSYPVAELVATYPTEAEAVARYAPHEGPYARQKYPGIYADLKTTFDGTMLLVENGVLYEKILLEYKTAKSSQKKRIDGNAHERLTFQIMQYLEVATRYTQCSLVVVSNGAFVRYKNKYHVNFHVQADRLRNFTWFSMEQISTSPEYLRFADGLLGWLLEGLPRRESKP